ncbi:MAG: hypothetical protein K1X67_04010 [Fimbriimonadaceae bacterium]|nr:hypothetical protein [Fimbriimonadaceae bacterium]
MKRTLLFSLAIVSTLGGAGVLVSSRAEAGPTPQPPRYVRLQSISPGIAEGGHINVTGTVRGGRFIGDGSQITNVAASSLLPGIYGGLYQFTNPGNVWFGNGSNLTGVVAEGLAAGTYGNAYTLNNPANVFFGNGANLTGVVATGLAGGVYSNIYTFSNAANTFNGVHLGNFVGDGFALFNLNAAALTGVVPDANLPTNIARLMTNNAVNDASDGFKVTQSGAGNAGNFIISNPASFASNMVVATNGIGSGVTVQLTNAANGARGIDVLQAGVGPGVFASSAGGNAIWGITGSISAAGVIGDNTFGESVVGRCTQGQPGVGAVVGRNDGVGGYGVRGFVTKDDAIGVLGQSGISGSKAHAARFENVNAANDRTVVNIVQHNSAIGLALALDVTGNANVSGNLSKGGGAFKIDHPLDPANYYLYHSFVESPDMKNIYDGVVACDGNGRAVVELPDYFEALNKDFRYQLTCVGGFSNVYIDQEVANNRFVIAGGRPGLKVSWQVTGIRKDAYANKHRIPNTVPKADEDRGYYLHPDAFGLPPSLRIGYQDPQVNVNPNLPSNRGVGN